MIRSKLKMGFVWALLTLMLHVWPGMVAPAHGQGSRKDDIVFNSRGIPLAGATVRVCAMPATGQPCTPLAQIYSDPALTQALANPTATDGLGNYSFYAAPGKYEIELSGPGITTKQLPNVILPNDPSSPTFSSVNSSGAISAFSLSLTGNLTVNGNTTVIGNMASGTLNLTNQSTPPGAAGSGTVNLYTKTADKRLYYKDDTGSEQGPLGAGAQTNATNTFTAAQNFDADIRTKGPNPWFDITRYGGYSSSSPPTTTGSITSGSTTLTLASAQDFANGQGIVVYGAGSTTGLQHPGQPTITPVNVLNGSTTYAYQVIAEDRNGGLTAASTAGSTATGAATLGSNTVSLTSCVRTNGVATYTTSANHNLQAGAQVQVGGFQSGFSNCNGVKTIATTPTGTTFTTNDGQVANENNTSGSPTVTAIACNTLSYLSGSYSGGNTIRYWIYRSTNGGAYSLVGVAPGIDPWFQDCGVAAPAAPGYVPATPPGTPQGGYLATTIVSGGGTTTLTLASSASTTVSSQTVLHDNSKPLLAAMQAAYNDAGGSVYIPNAGAAFAAQWPFNATTDMNTLTPGGGFSVRVHINSDQVKINQPWILASGVDVEGEPHDTTSFQYVNNTQISGSATPMFYINGGSGIHLSRIYLLGNNPQQTLLLSDENSSGGGTTGLVLDDSTLITGIYAPALTIKGGFDFFIARGTCGNQGATFFNGGTCVRFTNASPAVTGSTASQFPGRIRINGWYFSGTAISADCMPNLNVAGGGIVEMSHILFESVVNPLVRINCATNQNVFSVQELDDVTTADDLSGFGTPLIDAQNGSSNMGLTICRLCTAGAGNPPLYIVPNNVAGGLNVAVVLIGDSFSNVGNVTATGLGAEIGALVVNGTSLIVPMATLTAPPTVAVSSGGNVPVGTWYYSIQYLDVNGNASSISPIANPVTTTTGNQTITVTQPAAPAGAVSWYVYRTNCQGCGGARVIGGTIPVTQTSFVDTNNVISGQSWITPPTAGVATMTAGGLSGTGLALVNNGASLTSTFPNGLTANRTLAMPDVSGYNEVSGYLNSGYDNFTRANGAIGSNWTVTQNNLNVASNNIQGSTSNQNNTAYWSASPFAAPQFSQAAVTALNGTTDFIGVAALLSNPGGSTQGYDCIENTTNIYIQKIGGGTNTTLTSAASTGAVGDLLRLEATSGGALTCYKNGVSTLTTTDTTYTSGQPGLMLFGNVGTEKNWSGGNFHPFTHLDVEQDWIRTQHFLQGLAMGSETFTASPRSEQNVFLPGALTSTWTGATWTLDKAVTVTRLQVQAKTAPSGCTTNAIVRLTDGTTPVNLTISAAANDSGAISQNYAAGASLTVSVQAAAAGCTTSPADANVVVQYRMQ